MLCVVNTYRLRDKRNLLIDLHAYMDNSTVAADMHPLMTVLS